MQATRNFALTRPQRSAALWLPGLLAATVALPALAFVYGTRDGRAAFVLYREPKLAAIQILGWSLLAALFWIRREDLRLRALAAAVLRPPWRWLALFLAYGSVTALWVLVPENLFYELSQYLLLLLLVLSIGLWAWRDPRVPVIVEHGLVLSLGLAALVGLVQGVFPLAALSPIDPGSGVANPSLLGYKNPMALALVGQIFLLAHLVLARGLDRRGRLLAVLLAAELIYLASLRSRTSYAALVGSALFLGILLAARERFGRRTVRALLAGAGVIVLFMFAVAIDPGTRSRAGSALSHLAHPASYLESDRGIYLINSLNMVRHRPLGVGLGDWQTQYPVYRRVHRDAWFTAKVQVRKAHSDHVQALAETGWPGFALWVVFYVSLLAVPVRGYLRSGELRPLLLAAQVAAFGIAMVTDYVTEHPYLKFEFLLVAFLAATTSLPPAQPAPLGKPWAAAAITLLAVSAAFWSVSTVRKAWLGASMTESYLTATQRGIGDDERKEHLLAQAVRAGAGLARTPGYHKGLCDDYRILAAAELELGERSRALLHARASLRLHPYSPNTLWLLAALLRDSPRDAAQWQRAADYVMNEATDGFAEPYPAPPD